MVTYLGFLPRTWQLLPRLTAEHTARGVTHSTHNLKSFSFVFLEHFRIVQTCVWNGGHVSSCVMLCFREKMWGLTNCPGASGRGGARSCWCDPWPPRDSPLPPLTASASWRALSDAPHLLLPLGRCAGTETPLGRGGSRLSRSREARALAGFCLLTDRRTHPAEAPLAAEALKDSPSGPDGLKAKTSPIQPGVKNRALDKRTYTRGHHLCPFLGSVGIKEWPHASKMLQCH